VSEAGLPVELTIAFSVLTAATERLDRFLADQLSLSRTQAARLVAAEQALPHDPSPRSGATSGTRPAVRATPKVPAAGVWPGSGQGLTGV